MLQTTRLPLHARDVAGEVAVAPLRPRTATVTGGLQLSVSHDLRALEPDWRAFEQTADMTVFQCFDWLATYQKHVGSHIGVTPAVIVGRHGNDIAFILPLAVARWAGLRRLTFLGRDLCDYNAPLLAPDFAAKIPQSFFPELWRSIVAVLQEDSRLRHDLVLLDRMPGQVEAQSNPLRALAVSPHPSSAYRMRLGDDWETFYQAKRSSATRRRDRTKRKRLAESGPVGMVTTTDTAEAERTLNTLVAQKQLSFARMGVPDIFARPGHLDFYRDIVGDPKTRKIAHLSRLDVGPVMAAANLGLVFRGIYYHVLASYDAGPLSKFGPGAAHLHELMRYATEQRCAIFDFTIGDEPYKRDWCDDQVALFDHLAASTVRGAFAVSGMRIALAGKRTIKQSALWPTFMKARAALGGLCRSHATTDDTTTGDEPKA